MGIDDKDQSPWRLIGEPFGQGASENWQGHMIYVTDKTRITSELPDLQRQLQETPVLGFDEEIIPISLSQINEQLKKASHVELVVIHTSLSKDDKTGTTTEAGTWIERVAAKTLEKRDDGKWQLTLRRGVGGRHKGHYSWYEPAYSPVLDPKERWRIFGVRYTGQ